MCENIPTRQCSKCEIILPLSEEFFNKNQSVNTGGDKYFRPECKECTSKGTKGRTAAKKKAGNPKIPVLGTPCENCGRTNRELVFDHDHITLEHRGWLCDNCNRAIGMLGDDIPSIERVLKYLKKKKKK